MKLQAARSVAVSLALCAMMLRALLPDGWMPAAQADGVPFVICSADGAHHTGGKPPADQQRSHTPCAFAAAAPLSPPATPAILLPARAAVARSVHTSVADIFVASPDFRPNAARAPPTHV